MGVHGEQVRQGQGGQPEGQHLPHGYIQKHQGKGACCHEFDFFSLQGGIFVIFGGLHGFFPLFRVESGAEARFFHLGNDLLRACLRFIIADGHDAGGQIDLAAFHAGQLPGHPLHGCTAGGAVHAGDIVFFLSHEGPPVLYTPGGYFSASQFIPLGGICQGLFSIECPL